MYFIRKLYFVKVIFVGMSLFLLHGLLAAEGVQESTIDELKKRLDVLESKQRSFEILSKEFFQFSHPTIII